MSINEKIFKAYDIRGIYPTDLDEEIAYRLGKAFVVYLGATKVIVGRDMRLSFPPALHESLVKGLIEQGADVVDIGLATTDMFYYACGVKDWPGIIVTASHNPKEYGGFKMVRKLPDLIGGGNGMEEIRDLVVANNFPIATRTGSLMVEDIKPGFRAKVLSLVDVSKIKPLKIVVDAANGLGGMALDLIYKDLPVEIVRMYFEPDGSFPNHGGDPLQAANRRELEARVIAEKADLGFAFDPDADRFFTVDSCGQFIAGDYMTALMGGYLVKKNNGGNVIYDLRASWAVPDLIARAGGQGFANRVGHSYIKPRMQKENAIFGGEVTGHYYFRDFYFSDSGVIPSLVILEMMSLFGQSLAEIVRPLAEKYFISGEINFKVEDPDAIMVRLKEHYGVDNKIEELDGLSIIAADWHVNIRKSNTEPLLRLNLEAIGSKALMEQKRDELINLINQ